MCNYEIINLDDYIQSGEGGQSLTYTRKDGKAMAKLFLKSYGADCDREGICNCPPRDFTEECSGVFEL